LTSLPGEGLTCRIVSDLPPEGHTGVILGVLTVLDDPEQGGHMEASEAVRRVLDGEPRVEVTDARGRVVAAYFKRGRALFVADKDGERPIVIFEPERKPGH
jgi:hypothetical protein